MIAGRTSYRVGVLFMGVAFAGACDRPPQNDAKASAPVPAPVRPPPSTQPTVEWSYGESDDTYGSRAWFVQLGTDSASIYDPPGLTRLCRDLARTDAHRWGANLGAAGQSYEMDGPVMGEGGASLIVRTVDPRRGVADSSRITLHPILSHAHRTPPEMSGPDGVYSTLSTSAEEGDVLGSELILAELSTGLAGALVLGEGAASRPYTLRAISFVHDTVRFTTMSEAGPIKYIARIGARDATLWVAGDAERETLPRRGGTIEFLRRARARACRA